MSRDKDEDKDKDEAAKVDAQRAELTEVTRQRNALKSQQAERAIHQRSLLLSIDRVWCEPPPGPCGISCREVA